MDLPPPFSRPLEIGRGRFGRVFRVHRDDLDEWRVLKRFESDLSPAQAGVERMSVPTGPIVYGWHRVRGTSFLEMEWIRGVTLERLWSGVPFDPDLFAYLVSLAWRGLSRIHEWGGLHGDIKPEHVLFDRTGVRFLDFGFSTVGSAVAARGGSPRYLHPDLWEIGAVPERRHDLHSLRLVFLEFLRDRVESPTESADQWKTLLASERPEMDPRWTERTEAPFDDRVRERYAALVEASFKRGMNRLCLEASREASPRESLFLLQEALEWDPDDDSALELLNRIPPARPRRLVPVATLAASLMAVALCAAAVLFLSRPPASSAEARVAIASPAEWMDTFQPPKASVSWGEAEPDSSTRHDGDFMTTPTRATTGLLVYAGIEGCAVRLDDLPLEPGHHAVAQGSRRMAWTCDDGRNGSAMALVSPFTVVQLDSLVLAGAGR